MKNRKNYLKHRRKQLKMKQIGRHSCFECEKCGQKAKYFIYRYDAWCCISCNLWLEEKCSDHNCTICANRPESPHELYYLPENEFNGAGKRKLWRCKNYQHKEKGKIKSIRQREAVKSRDVDFSRKGIKKCQKNRIWSAD